MCALRVEVKDPVQNWRNQKSRFELHIASMKFFTPSLFVLVYISFNSSAQDIQIPRSVMLGFEQIQPSTQAHWDLKNDFTYEAINDNQIPMSKVFYVAQFMENGHVSAHVFNGHGKYIRKEVDISSGDLPALTQFLISSELKHPISKASRWMNNDGSVNYYVRLGHQSYLFGEYGDNLGRYHL